MSTNILLIIIIVLLALGLVLQLFQLIAIISIPNQFFDPLLNKFESDDDDDDIEYEALALERSTKGFAKTRKSKKAKWTVPDKTLPKKPLKDKSKTKGTLEQTETEAEVVNGTGDSFRVG